jgi:predicted HD superfamily hydrolase involved in NAD metabolism
MHRAEGVPAGLTIELVRDWLVNRVSPKRFKHTAGVAEVACRLAPEAGCDLFPAELAAWLHDACKEVKDRELVAMAEGYGMDLSPLERSAGHLLHGPVAAALVAEKFGITSKLILDAISQHTLGFVPMTPLSKVLFLADCLEDGRPKDYTKPIWEALDFGDRNDFDRAIVVACDLGIKQVIDSGRPIHPRTVAVRNYHLDLVRTAEKQ